MRPNRSVNTDVLAAGLARLWSASYLQDTMDQTLLRRNRVAGVWLVANLLLATAFLGVASLSWIEPELAHVPGASGGAALFWVVTAVPIFFVSALGNFAVAVWATLFRRREGWWPMSRTAWLALPLWGLVLLLDNSRHGV